MVVVLRVCPRTVAGCHTVTMDELDQIGNRFQFTLVTGLLKDRGLLQVHNRANSPTAYGCARKLQPPFSPCGSPNTRST